MAKTHESYNYQHTTTVSFFCGLEVDLAARGSWAFSFTNSSIKSKLPFFQIQTRSSKSLQRVKKALSIS